MEWTPFLTPHPLVPHLPVNFAMPVSKVYLRRKGLLKVSSFAAFILVINTTSILVKMVSDMNSNHVFVIF